METQYTCKKCGWSGVVRSRPRCLECARKNTQKWRKENPEKALEQKRRYNKRFREERREEYNAKRRRTRSKERNAEAWQRRREWLLSGDVERVQLIELYERSNGQCNYCGTKVKPRFTPSDCRGFDHVIARANGGKHTISNLVVCCGDCNAKKSDK